jgi:hypothetical protein
MNLTVKLLSAILLGLGALHQEAHAQEAVWQACREMIGTWTSCDKPEKGTGSFSISSDLGGKVLVRRNHAELPAGGGRPAGIHDDLMVIYQEPGTRAVKAEYFDNEGHVIHYSASLSQDQKSLSFLSGAKPSAPGFRLSYVKTEGGMIVRFEIAAPGKPDAFRVYLEGKVCRQGKDER